MRILSILILTSFLSACSMIGLGGNVYPDHPQWAKDAFERQEQVGSP